MSIDLMFSKHLTYAEHNTKDGGDSGYSEEEFLMFMQGYPEFTNVKNTYFRELDYYQNVLKWDDKTISKFALNAPKNGYLVVP